MNPIAIISLIISIVRMLPKLISIGSEIIKLIPKFSQGGFLNDLGVIMEIIKLILGLATDGDKGLAQVSMIELRNRMRMGDREGILRQRDSLRRRRSVNKGLESMEPVEKV
jgi:hypothetical protein